VYLLQLLGLAVCALKLKSAFAPPRKQRDGVHFLRTSLRTFTLPGGSNMDTATAYLLRGERKRKGKKPFRWSNPTIEMLYLDVAIPRDSLWDAIDGETTSFQTQVT
jgi:hypothetical protein